MVRESWNMSAPSVEAAALLDRLPEAQISGDPRQLVTGIETVSQAVRPGALFVALHGVHTDGHRYVPEAVANGARVIVVDAAYPAANLPGVTVASVADTRRALSVLSAAFYGDPSLAVDVIGITGTNGKTTTSRMVSAILYEGGIPCGVIGTVGAEFDAHTWQLANTKLTPRRSGGSLRFRRYAFSTLTIRTAHSGRCSWHERAAR
jgi:UDP-N-acetylmuramoyl-L-alanyl-D-glutamate--2,6-diaminopimelate ligase